VVAALAGCRREPPPCPPVAVIEALHATAFQLEHGDAAVARAAFDEARALATGPLDPTTQALMTQLGRALDAPPDEARVATESVRASFQDWACLPEETHRAFHAKLPAPR
jgi:hypothetical protein